MELPLHFYVDPDNVNKVNDDYIHPGKVIQCGGSNQRHFVYNTNFRFIRSTKLASATFRERHQTEKQTEKMVWNLRKFSKQGKL